MNIRNRYSAAAAVMLLLTAGSVHAETTIEAYYQGEILHNSTGGIDTGGTYLEDAGLTVQTDLEELFGVPDSSIFLYLLWNNHNTFSDRYVGDLQGISNIDAERALRIYELWYELVLSEAVTLRFGLYDLNSEFDAIDTAGFFLNSSHGIGPDYSQSGEAGPSIFPVTSLAARLQWTLSDSSTLRYALLDGVPGDPDDPSKTAIELGDGELHALEFDHVFDGGTRFGIGTWHYSARFDRIDGNGRDDGNAGYYGFVDVPLLSRDDGVDLSAFLRYGVAEDSLNVLDSYIGAGVVVTGLVASRPEDRLGLAVASAQVGGPFKRVAAAAGTRADSSETNIEFSYNAKIRNWLRVQPNIQYVINPGADRTLDDALVIGVRFKLIASGTFRPWHR